VGAQLQQRLSAAEARQQQPGELYTRAVG